VDRLIALGLARLAGATKAIDDFDRKYVIRTENGTGLDEAPPRFVVDDDFMKWINSRQFRAKGMTE
jgi:hypothetical protein